MAGTLYGVGVGPGAPDLITLRAFRLITGAPVIAYPAPDSGESFARSIVAGSIHPGKTEIPIVIPMRTERFPAAEIYDRAAREIAGHLDEGRDVVVLCEGDPFFYGSFMYLFERMQADYRVEIVPGVSSVMTAAAEALRPLSARNDVMTVIPGPLDDDAMRARIEAADTVAIMKLGRHFARVRALIDGMGLTGQSVYCERVSLEDQRTMPLGQVPEDAAPYFSMILIYKGSETWISGLPVRTSGRQGK